MARIHQAASLNFVRRKTVKQLLGASVASVGAAHSWAYSTVFISEEKASQLLLASADRFISTALAFSEAQLRKIASTSQTKIPSGFAPQCVTGWANGTRVGWVLFDRVIGKYDLIDYAMGFLADSTSTGLEVLAYRESHGGEIRNTSWRQQFVGKKGPQQLRAGDEIRNISGATLSCQHVTEGAQRLSAVAALLSAY